MEKLLENITSGKINGKNAIEINYNNKILWSLPFILEYTLDVEDTNTDALNSKLRFAYYNYLIYLPEINDYGEYSYNHYKDVLITLKDDSIVRDLSTAVKDIKSVKIIYSEDVYRIRFYGSSSCPHRIKELKYINTIFVTNMSSMFYECSSLTSLDLSSFDTSNVTDMYGMFYRCSNLISLNLSNFNTSNVTRMSDMFAHCSKLTSLDLSNFDTSNVTDMSGMFFNCKNLTSLDLSNFNTSNVTDMASMFYWCSLLTSLDVSNFDTSNVTRMSSMFVDCSKLTSLDLSSFNTSNVTDMSYMFLKVPSSCKIYIGDGFTLTESDTSFSGTFTEK